MKLILSLVMATLFLFVPSSLIAKPTQCDAAKAIKVERTTYEGKRFSVHIEGPSKGDVDDVILIPGLASPRDVWNTTLAAKRGCKRIHVLQIRGFGDDAQINADGPVLDPFIEELADYITQHIVAKTGKKPAIIGHSMGGLSSLIVAARYPDRVGKVMVVDSLPFIGTLFNPCGDGRVSASASRTDGRQYPVFLWPASTERYRDRPRTAKPGRSFDQYCRGPDPGGPMEPQFGPPGYRAGTAGCHDDRFAPRARQNYSAGNITLRAG
jgi:pimeloyl-ACP methyl ester carboxylesterase